jgi:uncharacterized protein YlxW (UPF0749 family)
MALDRDQVELIVKTIGQEGVDKLSQSVDGLEKQLKELAAQYATTDMSAEKWAQDSGKLHSQLTRQKDLLDQLKGNKSISGQGILGASYAAQDFLSTIADGGFGRALGSMANNVPQILTLFGAGAGLAGVMSAVTAGASAAITAWEKWNGALEKDAAKAAKKSLEELRSEMEQLNKEFEKLRNAPTSYEKESAEGVENFLKERPHSVQAQAAIVAAVQRGKVKLEDLPHDMQKALKDEFPTAFISEKETRQQAYAETHSRNAKTGVVEETGNYKGRTIELLSERLSAIMRAAEKAGGQVVAQSKEAGPVGDPARALLLRATEGMPGFEELQNYTPEKIEAAEKDWEENIAPGAEQAEESGRALSRHLGKRRAKEKQDEGKAKAKAGRRQGRINRAAEDDERVSEATPEEAELTPAVGPFDAARERNRGRFDVPFEPGSQNDEYWRGVRYTREHQQAGMNEREAGRQALLRLQAERHRAEQSTQRLLGKPEQDVSTAQLHAQADDLISHGADIAGQAFGPQAAMMASNARPDQIHDIRGRTIKNLEAGQAPYQALLEAFRDVMERSERNARESQQFVGQLNGLRHRSSTTSQPFRDNIGY